MSQKRIPLGFSSSLPVLPSDEVALYIERDGDLFEWCWGNPGSCHGEYFWSRRIVNRYGEYALDLIKNVRKLSLDIWYITDEAKVISELYEGIRDPESITIDNIKQFVLNGWIVLINYIRSNIDDYSEDIKGHEYTNNSSDITPDVILFAIEANRLDLITLFIEQWEFDPDDTGLSSVAVAAEHNYLDIVDYLITKSTEDESWLIGAAASGNVDTFKHVVSMFEPPVPIDQFAFYEACKSGNISLLKYMIQIGYNPNVYDGHLMTESAIQSQNPEVVRYLQTFTNADLDIVQIMDDPVMSEGLN